MTNFRQQLGRETQTWWSIALAGLIAVGGCATRTETDQMVPTISEDLATRAMSPLRGAIALEKVGGGEEPSPPGLTYSTVGGEELEEALRFSLRKYGFLSATVAAARYRLKAFLIEIRRPAGGITTTATSFVRYKLTRVGDGKVVYDDILSATASKSRNEEFVGVVRVRKVLEASVRQNIAAFLRNLNAVEIE